MKYLYVQPQGGFNDTLCVIKDSINYCKNKNVTLLIDTLNATYRINFADYFKFDNSISDHANIITDICKIKEIIKNKNIKIYPNNLDINEILNGKKKFNWTTNGYLDLENKPLSLPDYSVFDAFDLAIHVSCGGEDAARKKPFSLYSKLILSDSLVNHAKEKYESIKKPYLSIHIRNTDYKCDYKSLFFQNEAMIRSYEAVHVSTDDKSSLDFFTSNNVKVINFTTFPQTIFGSGALHYAYIKPDIKIKDLFTDILIASFSENIISVSKGNFIQLLRDCFRNKKIIAKQFHMHI
jgi:hypothetical protein